MTKLTEGQRAMLLKALARADSAVAPPRGTTKRSAKTIAARLIARKLLQACRAKPSQPVWGVDENGKRVSLIVTNAGRAAVGGVDRKQSITRSPAGSRTQPANRADAAQAPSSPRTGSKQALLVGMLARQQGATLADLIAATGWLPHTTRAALTGLRKRGHAIARTQMAEGRGRATGSWRRMGRRRDGGQGSLHNGALVRRFAAAGGLAAGGRGARNARHRPSAQKMAQRDGAAGAGPPLPNACFPNPCLAPPDRGAGRDQFAFP
jgi:hypothetical protein